MAGLNRKLNGYVLLESMMAMVVVMLCFGIGMMICGNVISGSRGALHVRARIALEQEAKRLQAEDRLLDGEAATGEFRMVHRITPVESSPGIYELKLLAITPDGKQIAEYHELIRQE
jgi:hypothetical protein